MLLFVKPMGLSATVCLQILSFGGTAQQCIDPLACNFFCVGIIKTLVYSTVTVIEETLCQHIYDTCKNICNCPRNFGQMQHSMIMYDHLCIYSGGEHLEHLSNCVLINNNTQQLLNWECAVNILCQLG
jgi:hypothetical protein